MVQKIIWIFECSCKSSKIWYRIDSCNAACAFVCLTMVFRGEISWLSSSYLGHTIRQCGCGYFYVIYCISLLVSNNYDNCWFWRYLCFDRVWINSKYFMDHCWCINLLIHSRKSCLDYFSPGSKQGISW